jgi:hypothetical protein
VLRLNWWCRAKGEKAEAAEVSRRVACLRRLALDAGILGIQVMRTLATLRMIELGSSRSCRSGQGLVGMVHDGAMKVMLISVVNDVVIVLAAVTRKRATIRA